MRQVCIMPRVLGSSPLPLPFSPSSSASSFAMPYTINWEKPRLASIPQSMPELLPLFLDLFLPAVIPLSPSSSPLWHMPGLLNSKNLCLAFLPQSAFVPSLTLLISPSTKKNQVEVCGYLLTVNCVNGQNGSFTTGDTCSVWATFI